MIRADTAVPRAAERVFDEGVSCWGAEVCVDVLDAVEDCNEHAKPVMPLMRIEPDDLYQRVQHLVLDIFTSHRPWKYAARNLHLFAHMFRSFAHMYRFFRGPLHPKILHPKITTTPHCCCFSLVI